MDPNDTLARLVRLCEEWQEWGDLEVDPVPALDEVSELVLALDNWLSQGGFRPDSWR